MSGENLLRGNRAQGSIEILLLLGAATVVALAIGLFLKGVVTQQIQPEVNEIVDQ